MAALGHRPQFFGDGPPIGAGAERGEHGVEPHVDALDEHEARRDVAEFGHVTRAVEDLLHAGPRVLVGEGRALVRQHRLVEVPEPVEHVGARHPRTRLEHLRSLEDAAVGLAVALEDDRADHVLEQLDLGRLEPLHQPEVEERDPAARFEQIVARMGVAVERVQSVETAEDEPEDGLAREVLLFAAPRLDLGQADPSGEFGRQDATGAEFGHDVGNVDEGMASIKVGEQGLILGLEAVVEFLGEPVAELADERAGFEPGEQHSHDAEQEVRVLEVGGDGFVDSGILDLHGDGPSVVGHGPMHLADRRRCDRHGVPLGEGVGGWSAEFALDDAGRQSRRHRGRVLLQAGEGCTDRLGEPVVEVARHLPELHQGTLHVAERGRDLGRRGQLELGVEGLLALRRREDPLRPIHRRGRPEPSADPGELAVSSPPAGPHRRRRRGGTPTRAGDHHDAGGGQGEQQQTLHRGGVSPTAEHQATRRLRWTLPVVNRCFVAHFGGRKGPSNPRRVRR